MKVGIFSELYAGDSLGGREYIAFVLAEALSERGDTVEFIHHKPGLTNAEVARRFGTSPESVRLREAPLRPRVSVRHFRRRERERAEWLRTMTGAYDCFVHIAHQAPVRCYARTGVLIVLFPIYRAFEVPLRSEEELGLGFRVARHYWTRAHWPRLIAGYQIKTSISQYVQTWTRKRWRIETDVVYPPADDFIRPSAKENLILSVGRFSSGRSEWVNKRQLEMMQAFAELRDGGDWHYTTAGSVGESAPERDYFAAVQALANGRRAAVQATPSRAEIQALYGKAKVFWHAAGYGNDENISPELSEHYGIATVDAMSAGCVPIVVRKGGQTELVEDGVTGFFWDSVEELKEHTARVMADDAMRARIAEAAQARAREFSRERFVGEWLRLLPPT